MLALITSKSHMPQSSSGGITKAEHTDKTKYYVNPLSIKKKKTFRDRLLRFESEAFPIHLRVSMLGLQPVAQNYLGVRGVFW